MVTAQDTEKRPEVKAVVIDNFDSFVFNLVDELERRGCGVEVWRNNITADLALGRLRNSLGPKLLVLSPGPGNPGSAGCSVELVRRAPRDVVVFGVCLGHQAIVEAFGGRVGAAEMIVHGKASQISHTEQGLFYGLGSPLKVGRYHSLVATEIPPELKVSAWLKNEPMAVEHEKLKIFGVQFHPESILTPAGGIIIDNVIREARSAFEDKQAGSRQGRP